MANFIPLFFVLALLTLLFLGLIRQCRVKKKAYTSLPPGPPGLPLIGNLHQLNHAARHVHLSTLSKQYGPIMTLHLGFKPTLVVSSSKMASHVFKNHDQVFGSRPSLVGQQKLSYNGLDVAFTPYSNYWREMRKLFALHLFSHKRVQSFRSIRENEVKQMIRDIKSHCSLNKVSNLSDITMSYACSLICKMAFGRRYEEEGFSGRSKFHGLINEVQAMFGTFFFADYFPCMGWFDRLRGLHWRLDKIFKEMDVIYQEIINHHLAPNRLQYEQEDLIDVLLRIKKDPSFPIQLTWNHIKAVLMDVFVAGTDTSAGALVWAMTALMKNPKVMVKAQEEVRSLCNNHHENFIDEDDVQRLPYLKAVVKETMRLYPPAPLLARQTTESCNINGHEIPPKTLVIVNVWTIGRDPEAWKGPEEFNPERFLGSSNYCDYKGVHDYELIPFGVGRRSCPGANMGLHIVELALANLLYSFDWKLPNGMKKEDIDSDVIPGLTPHKKNALCLVPKNYL